MCGIIGYIGYKDSLPILMDGLSRLEYRGYDSAGIAVVLRSGNIAVRKAVGVLSNLVEEVKRHPPQGRMGIGHTRWATHGRPSQDNCHPHEDCTRSIFVVHNGIIENYQELKHFLHARGHRFNSQTDTEVIAHLVEEEFKNGASDLFMAVHNCMKRVRGAYAMGIMRRQEPHCLVAARQGSPLVIGVGKRETFIASDATAILHRTRDVIYMEDGQVASITPRETLIMDKEGKSCPVRVHKVVWEYELGAKGPYEKFMAKEIHEQPQIIEQTLDRRTHAADGSVVLEDVHLSVQKIKKLSKIYIVSCGTAYYAGLVGKYLLERYLSVPVEAELASEFRYRERKPLDRNALVIAVTQSGETADTLASVRDAKSNGCTILSICNSVGSTIARESDSLIYTHAGPEIAVASTKAYTAQILAFYLLAMHFGKVRGEIGLGHIKSALHETHKVPGQIRAILEKESRIEELSHKYYHAKSIFYLGRGFNYPTALEGALKNKEISYMHAEGYPAGELKHGPIAMIDAEFPVVCICTRSSMYEKMISNIKEVEARNARVILLANEGDHDIRHLSEDIMSVPETWEEISPLTNIVPLQLFAYHIARLKGCDVDKPRNLAKSVTVE